VRGNVGVIGVNDFTDNSNSTVTDNATGLMWQQADDGTTREWADSLSYCEALSLAGHFDWRLPDNKELQSIVDYDKTDWPAIDTNFFDCTYNAGYPLAAPEGDYGWYWTSTTFGDSRQNACYIAFGKAWGDPTMPADAVYYDTHGSGAQRSDAKDVSNLGSFDCSVNGCDEERALNYSRCVRNIDGLEQDTDSGPSDTDTDTGMDTDTGGGVPTCGPMQPPPCCGDAFCGGPENPINCAADCP
jgi:hypothetical protein